MLPGLTPVPRKASLVTARLGSPLQMGAGGALRFVGCLLDVLFGFVGCLLVVLFGFVGWPQGFRVLGRCAESSAPVNKIERRSS